MAPFPVRNRFAGLLVVLSVFVAAVSGCGDTTVGKAESVAAVAGAAGGPGFFDGSPSDPVRFDSPSGAAVIGTDRFVADTRNHVIRKIDGAGIVSTFAGTFGLPGSADGTGPAARFSLPSGIAAVGNTLYVCDTGNHTIRKIIATSGAVTTLAGSAGLPGFTDGTGTAARFSSPRGIASDGTTVGTTLYVADTGNHTIRKITDVGATTTFAGQAGVSGSDDGLGLAAQFSSPEGVALIGIGFLYVADTGNHTVRKVVVTTSFGDVTTLAGTAGVPGTDDGAGSLARFRLPSGIASDGTTLFVCDTGNHTLRTVSQGGVVITLAGTAGIPGFADGTGSAARFRAPAGIGTAGGGSSLFFVADTDNHVLRQVTASGVVSPVAGNPPRAGSSDGSGASARFAGPAGAAIIGGDLFLADTDNHTIRKVTPAGVVTTIAGSAGLPGSIDGSGTAARFLSPGGIAAVAGDLYVADSQNHTIRKVTIAGLVTTIAGDPGQTGSADGTGTSARFNNPQGIVALGGDLYVTDTGNHTIRKVTTAGDVTTLAGSPGTPGSTDGTVAARFNSPLGIAFVGTNLFVADSGNHTIRRVTTPAGDVDTFAGSAGQPGFADGQGGSARFSSPDGVAAVGSVLYVADRGNHAVRRISTIRKVTTFAGTPDAATTRNGDPSVALMNAPTGVAGEPGAVYFTDINENVVRKILF
ncbi:MAG: hypothetical protein WBA34_11395 [Candidatus Deferrimicrobiaceae bacterium]